MYSQGRKGGGLNQNDLGNGIRKVHVENTF